MARKETGRNTRQVSCRGLILQFKGAGSDMDGRYDDMICAWLRQTSKHFRRESIGDNEGRFLNLMKGENVVKAYDKSKFTDSADIRTMKAF